MEKVSHWELLFKVGLVTTAIPHATVYEQRDPNWTDWCAKELYEMRGI